MRFSLHLTRICLPAAALALALACPVLAQQLSKTKPGQPQAPAMPPPPKPPALVEPGGPSISLQTSEAVFDIAVALNACGYDNGLADSDPIREHIREQVDQASQQSIDARDARFHLVRRQAGILPDDADHRDADLAFGRKPSTYPAGQPLLQHRDIAELG